MNIGILSGLDKDAEVENPRLCDELCALGATSYILDYQTTTILESDSTLGLQIVSGGETLWVKPDAVITRVNEPDIESIAKARRFLDALEALHIPLTATASAVEICKDKMSTHDWLTAEGIPTPRTAMPTSIEATDIIPLLEYVEPNPNRAVIIKKIYGTKGIGVAKADSRRNALPFIQMLVDSNVLVVVQQYIDTKRNGKYRDIRHDVVSNEVVAAMLRESGNDFRTNLSLNAETEGGISDASGRKIRILPLHRELSIGAAAAVGANVAGIDILPSVHGGAYVDDINISPGFRIEAITGKNFAGPIARHACELALAA